MNSLIRHVILVYFFAVATVSAAPSQTSIQSKQFIAQPYPMEVTFEFAARTLFPIIHTHKAGYFLQVRDQHDFVLFVPNTGDELIARVEDGNLVFLQDYSIDAKQAYLTFKPGEWHKVISRTETHYKIEYTIGQTKMHCSVNSEHFQYARQIVSPEGTLVSRAVAKAQNAVCVLEFSTGSSGSGFLLYVGDELYCYTNQHVLMNLV